MEKGGVTEEQVLNGREYAIRIREEMLDRREAAIDAQRDQIRQQFNLIVQMVGPLVTRLELGPMDRVVSVAIEGADGEIRLVKL